MIVQNQFASLMKKWAEVAVEKISLIFSVSMSDARDAPAAEKPRAGQIDTGGRKSKWADGLWGF